MSAAWIKELLLDYGLNRLSIDQKNDIASAIDGLIKSRAITQGDVQLLHLYLAGYTSQEIADMHVLSTVQTIEAILSRIIVAIGVASGYTDEMVIQRAKQTQFRTKIPRFITFLEKHSTTYMEHDL